MQQSLLAQAQQQVDRHAAQLAEQGEQILRAEHLHMRNSQETAELAAHTKAELATAEVTEAARALVVGVVAHAEEQHRIILDEKVRKQQAAADAAYLAERLARDPDFEGISAERDTNAAALSKTSR